MKDTELIRSGVWALLSLLCYCVCMGYTYFTALRVLNGHEYLWLIGLPFLFIASYIIDRKVVSKHVPLKMIKAYEIGVIFVLINEIASILFYIFR